MVSFSAAYFSSYTAQPAAAVSVKPRIVIHNNDGTAEQLRYAPSLKDEYVSSNSTSNSIPAASLGDRKLYTGQHKYVVTTTATYYNSKEVLADDGSSSLISSPGTTTVKTTTRESGILSYIKPPASQEGTNNTNGSGALNQIAFRSYSNTTEGTAEVIENDESATGALFKSKVSSFREVMTKDGLIWEETVISEYEGNESAIWDGEGWQTLSGQAAGTPAAVEPEVSEIGIFADGNSNPYVGLSTLLGLDGYYADKTSLLDSLNTLIQKESTALTELLGNAIGEAGLGDVKKKLTFAEDAEGNIVVKGNISAGKRKKLAAIINKDPELVERIKTQKARMEIAEGLEGANADFSDQKYGAARTQLLKNVLKESGSSLEEFDKARGELFKDGKLVQDEEINEKYAGLTKLFTVSPEIFSEVDAYYQREAEAASTAGISGIDSALKERVGDTEDSTRSLLAMKRGVLTEGSDKEPDFALALDELRKNIMETIVAEYNNSEAVLANPDLTIMNFTMRFDAEGNLRFTDVETGGDVEGAAKAAEQYLNSKAGGKSELGLAILDDHDDYHGDVEEYDHEVISGPSGGYKIESKEADKAAMQEFNALSKEIGSALNSYFQGTLKIKSPFSLKFDEGKLTMLNGESLSSMEGKAVNQVLQGINGYLKAVEKGEETEGMLSPKLSAIADKLVKLQEVEDKVHDKSLLPSGGVKFEFGK